VGKETAPQSEQGKVLRWPPVLAVPRDVRASWGPGRQYQQAEGLAALPSASVGAPQAGQASAAGAD
jgi:hypothetical protein